MRVRGRRLASSSACATGLTGPTRCSQRVSLSGGEVSVPAHSATTLRRSGFVPSTTSYSGTIYLDPTPIFDENGRDDAAGRVRGVDGAAPELFDYYHWISTAPLRIGDTPPLWPMRPLVPFHGTSVAVTCTNESDEPAGIRVSGELSVGEAIEQAIVPVVS